MDVNPESSLGTICDDLAAVNNPTTHVLSVMCALCHRTLSSDIETTGDLEPFSVCGDCKFLLLEDLEITSPDVFPRRMPRSRRSRYNSSESIDSMFPQRFSQMLNLARENQSMQDIQSVDGDGDGAARLVQPASSSGSRRWRRVFSDTESEGFDSVYGESEANASFRRIRVFHGEVDTISYSAYGGESDASLDGQSFLENENFGHPNGYSDLESDTDIDPMNAGLYHWNSEEEEEEYGGSEWEEADIEGNTLHGSSRFGGSNFHINWRRQYLPSDVEGTSPFRLRDRIQARTDGFLTNFEEQIYAGGSGDYVDARGFENILEHLAETESLRRGAPPASVSFVNNMTCMTINEDNLDSMACAICKDAFTIGTVVNQLPCFHLYHRSCILPWLSARNTCPLCRYELPTDDKDYEARKRNGPHSETGFHVYRHDDRSLGATYYDEAVVDDGPYRFQEQRESANAVTPRNRWFFSAVAPIISVVGISLILWFGNSSADRRRRYPSGRRENSPRKWWSFFR